MDEKQFEQDYRNWKRQSAPDLWNRIEGNLKEHPESVIKAAQREASQTAKGDKQQKKPSYRLAAGLAAVLCLAALAPGLYAQRSVNDKSEAGFAETTYVAGAQETTSAMEVRETKGEGGADKGDAGIVPTSTRLRVPDNAVTLSSDSTYFSQAILQDTELLCTGTVKDVSLEYDEEGRAVRVVYQFALEQIHFAQDYLTQTSQITIKSPIVKAEGEEAWILYQMEPGKTYLLPLKKQEENWELLYPFAPQIQQTGEHAYLFHSGYSSLMNEETQVVSGACEGENDYFYDRMLWRGDDGFLSDVLELIQMPQ